MGWKNVRDHYEIEGVVSFDGEVLYIGSVYVTESTAVARDGRIIKCSYRRGAMGRYVDAIEQDPTRFTALLAAPDSFEHFIRVYTYQDDRIIETFCEETGFPNTTHDGQIMFENSHFLDRSDAVSHAIASLESRIKNCDERILELGNQLSAAKANCAEASVMLARLITAEATE